MASVTLSGEFDRRVLKNIRFHARRLAGQDAVPGMAADDFEQDLQLDLIKRSAKFDPTRSAFPTFADRVVGHRVAALTSPTARLVGDRRWSPIDVTLPGDDDDGLSLLEILADDAPPLDEIAAIRIDVGAFVRELPRPLVECCDILLSDNVTAGARAAGIHRSQIYERAGILRSRAVDRGLDVYVRPSDRPAALPVRGDACAFHEVRAAMDTTVHRAHLLTDEAGFAHWLSTAIPGQVLEYYRGFIAADVAPLGRLCERDRLELVRVASAALRAWDAKAVHLLQRRHGAGQYSYLAVRRLHSGGRP